MQDEMKPQVQQPQVDNSEAQMARADLYRGAKNAMKLFQMVQDGQQLEGWVQAKITKAADYLDSVYHYMEYQAKFGQGGVATSLDDITSDAQVTTKQGEVSEEDDEEGIKESMNYEQKLQALLESAKKKMKPAKKDEKVEEGFPTVADARARSEKEKGTGKFDKKQTSTGTVYTRKSSTYDDGGDDSDTKAAKKKAKKVKEGAKPDFLDMDKDGNKKEPMKKAVADKKKNPFAKKDSKVKEVSQKTAMSAATKRDQQKPEDMSAATKRKDVMTHLNNRMKLQAKADVKEADDRVPTKKKEREITLPSGAKTKATTYQGWQSQKADKAADKEKKDSMKESVMESTDLKNLKFLAGLK